MSKRYFILGAVLIIVAFGLVLLPDSVNKDQVPPEKLLKEIMSQSRYISPDLVASRMIDEDPSIFLVDVRSAEEYSTYSLPGALNIPLENLLDNEWKPYLEQTGVDVVLISNDNLYAEQAWVLCTRSGYKNIYVLKGGLNQWFADIMQPQMPAPTEPAEAFDLYTFRKGASKYFGGGSDDQMVTSNKSESLPVIQRTKKSAAAGGC
ncbi:MAG: rhodanese-like domain-containing protein [Bacteroidales bacterium]|nr:rhodanese-like domain-containing protein [Bacteroidales bacterium]